MLSPTPSGGLTLGSIDVATAVCRKRQAEGHAAGMQALSNAEGTLREFVANSAVFVGMSDIWYEKLYKTEVKGSVANDVGALGRLDELLSKIMELSLTQTAESTAEAFANATFSALQHTLLHGGEFRYYSLEDADQLQADLRAFKVSKLYPICASGQPRSPATVIAKPAPRRAF